jgi:hypothetical protein
MGAATYAICDSYRNEDCTNNDCNGLDLKAHPLIFIVLARFVDLSTLGIAWLRGL